MSLVSVSKKIVKPLKKLPKKILKIPRIIYAYLSRFYRWVASFAGRFQFLSLRTLSGKLLAGFEFLLFLDILLGVVYGVSLWQGYSQLLTVSRVLATYTVGSTVVLFALFVVVYPFDSRGVIEGFLVDTGVRQRSRMSPWLIAAAVGVPSAVGVTAVLADRWLGFVFTALSILDALVVIGIFVLSVALLTGGVYAFLAQQNEYFTHHSLTVVAVRDHDDDTQIAVLRNDGDGPVSLWQAKVEDSKGNRYLIDRTVSFRPGDKRELKIPGEFDLEPTEFGLPPLLGRFMESERETTVYDREGDVFVLQWEA